MACPGRRGTAHGTGFPGAPTDAETGLSFLQARRSSPAPGRFASPDTVIPNAPGTQGYNLYAYAANNPMTVVDLSGHELDRPAWAMAMTFACLLTPWCVVAMEGFLNMVKEGLRMTVAGLAAAPIAAWVSVTGAFIAIFGVIGVLFTLVMCGLDVHVSTVSGHTVLTGCGALAQDAYDQIEDLKSAGPLRDLPKNIQKLIEPESCSFSDSTLVATSGGERPISQVRVGDSVYAWNEGTGKIGVYSVTAVLSHTDPVIEDLTIDGETLKTTPEHPFYTEEQGWLPAGALVVGMHLREATGSGRVGGVFYEAHAELMFNLTVETAHTFYVGTHEALVHNTCEDELNDLRQRIYNIRRDHLKSSDLDAARRELNGEVVKLKSTGVPYNHVHEVVDGQNGLRDIIKKTNSILGRTNLTADERAEAESILSEASQLLDYTEGWVP